MGLLNSRLLFWKLRQISNVFRGGWITCTKQYFGELPIREIDFKVKHEKHAHDRIAELVEQITAYQSELLQFAPVLEQRIHHEHRTPCSLAHYLQRDYMEAVKAETLIDDVMRKFFLHRIDIETDGNVAPLVQPFSPR